MTLARSGKVLGIYFTKQNSNSLFLEWHSITYQGHICSYTTKTFHICLLLCVEFGQVLWPLLRDDVSCFQDQNSCTRHIKQLFLHWEYAKTCSHLPKINTPCFKNTISLAYFQKETTKLCKKIEKKNGTHEGPKI
jgi:hypothetical protein